MDKHNQFCVRQFLGAAAGGRRRFPEEVPTAAFAVQPYEVEPGKYEADCEVS